MEDLSTDQTFDGATSIFVSHFLQTRDAKEQYFGSIARRLRPGAPFVFADLYEPNGAEKLWAAWQEWFTRAGASDEEVERVFSKMEDEISFVPEAELDQIAQTAGFATLTRVYQSFLWGAWWTWQPVAHCHFVGCPASFPATNFLQPKFIRQLFVIPQNYFPFLRGNVRADLCATAC